VVERELQHRAFEARAVAEQQVVARAGEIDAARDVEDPVQLAQFDVIARREVEVRRRGAAPEFDVVGVAGAVGHFRRGRHRQPQRERAHGVAQRGFAGVEVLQARLLILLAPEFALALGGAHRAEPLGGFAQLGAQRLGFGQQSAMLAIAREEVLDHLRVEALAPRGLPHGVGVFPHPARVQHQRRISPVILPNHACFFKSSSTTGLSVFFHSMVASIGK
jgi:hypothetical protein